MVKPIRYSARDAQQALGIGHDKFWRLVKQGVLAVYYDGARAFLTPETIEQYDQACRANTVGPLKKSDKLKQNAA